MEPLISVIIPVYNTGNFLEKCLKSAVEQTYRNLEFIVVDDGSTDHSLEIIENFRQKDSRIKVIRHDHNRGLFQARLSGADQAKGDFIAFLDSDDFLAADTYRRMLNAALAENADIVEANFVMVNEKNEFYVHSLNRVSAERLEGEEIRKAYFGQRGLAYHWHVVWNKLYRRDLWERCRPIYNGIDHHLVMTEDIVYSTVLFCKAQKYISIEYDGYFYFRNSQSATCLIPKKDRFVKQITDLSASFYFIERYLSSEEYLKQYEEDFREWKRRYFRIWCQNIETVDLPLKERIELFELLKGVFGEERIEVPSPVDNYHYSDTSKWNGIHYNAIIEAIRESRTEYVSFDVFDTLIKRPFYAPHDLFEIMNYELIKKFPEEVKFVFSELRKRAEAEIRNKLKERNPFYQDITLDEIYDYMYEEYLIPNRILRFAKELEIYLEYRFCSSRRSAKELYDLAKYLDKKIIIVSDMYLPKEIIEKILHKNGYTDYERLYISSEIRLTKHNGDLFRYILQDLGIKAESIVHIGDNWDSDYVKPRKFGMRSYFFPKATSVLMGEIQGTLSNHFQQIFNNPAEGLIDHRHFLDYLGQRSMLAIVANRYFDNPLRQFNPDSYFNVDPYFIGYFALGMNMLGVGLWMMDIIRRSNYKTIHFIARDGYLIKIIFEKLKRHIPVETKANYLHVSRKTLLPLTLEEPYNLFALYHLFNVQNYSPREILSSFLRINRIDDNLQLYFRKKGVLLDKRFSSADEFNYFAKVVIEFDLLKSNLREYRERVYQYLDRLITDRDAIFDIGYNGTTQIILTNFLNKQIDAFYIHMNKDRAVRPNCAINSNVYTFLDYTPSIKGTIREYLYSEPGPACVEYQFSEEGEIKPIFEESSYNVFDHFVLKRVHQGVLDFVDDFLESFHEYLHLMTFRNYEISLPLEDLLQRPNREDQKVFSFSTFKDELTGDYTQDMTLLDIWNIELEKINKRNQNIGREREYHFLEGKSMWAKAIYFLLFDFQTFKKRAIIKFKHKVMRRPLNELVKDL